MITTAPATTASMGTIGKLPPPPSTSTMTGGGGGGGGNSIRSKSTGPMIPAIAPAILYAGQRKFFLPAVK